MKTFEPLLNNLENLKNQIELIFNVFQVFTIIIIFLFIIWVIGFVRRNLGLDRQTKELIQIRKLLEKKSEKD